MYTDNQASFSFLLDKIFRYQSELISSTLISIMFLKLNSVKNLNLVSALINFCGWYLFIFFDHL